VSLLGYCWFGDVDIACNGGISVGVSDCTLIIEAIIVVHIDLSASNIISNCV